MKTEQTYLMALSIRQPWAWLIVNGYKDIENRGWQTSHRGRLLIHAAKTMTAEEYAKAKAFALGILPALVLPTPDQLEMGGLVGECEVTTCVTRSASRWFEGPNGFVLQNAKPMPFRPWRGEQGTFKVPLEILS